MKRFLRQDLVQRAIAWLCMQFMRLAWATSRWEVIGGEPPILASGRPFIGAFWHGRMLMMPTMWRRRMPISMLVSEHADGRLISRVIARFGIGTIAGSSSNGGAAAVRTMVKTLKGGDPVVVTPDGPRGPRMRASAGLVVTARLSGAPIVPVTYSTTRGRVLDDRLDDVRRFLPGRDVLGVERLDLVVVRSATTRRTIGHLAGPPKTKLTTADLRRADETAEILDQS